MIRNERLRIATSGRVLWLCSLCLFLTGCSGAYQSIPVLTSAQGNSSPDEDPAGLEFGDQIRLTHQDGTRTEGTYAGIRDHGVVVKRAEATYSEAEGFDEIRSGETVPYAGTTEFPLAEIAILEKYNSKTTESLLIAGGIACTVWVFAYSSQHVLDDFAMGDWGY